MSMGSVRTNTIKSRNISVFRVAIALCLSLYFHNIFTYVLVAAFLFSFSYKETALYIFILSSCLLVSHYRRDFMPWGIVDFRNNNYYVVDKIFYKVALYTKENLNCGQIISCCAFDRTGDLSFLKKNILYSGSTYLRQNVFLPRLIIQNQIGKLNETSSAIVSRIMYNRYVDDEALHFSLGYGLYSYYFLNHIRKRSVIMCIVSVLLISILFNFELKFILLLIDCLFHKEDRENILSYKLILICIINRHLFSNYSILLPLLFSLIGMLKTRYDFRIYLLFIESLFFKEIDLFETLMFSFLMRIKIFFYIFSMLTVFMPFLEKIYIFSMNIYSFINQISFSIRGSISLISIILFLLMERSFRPNLYMQIALLCLLILSPFNQPFVNVCFIDVGQGDSALIKYPFSRSCVLIDTGSAYNYHKLRKTLFAKGIYVIDYLIISHDDEDHNGNIDNLKKDFRIKKTIEEGEDLVFHNTNYRYLYLGDFDNDNDNSLVYLVEIDGFSFLFTGDLSKKAENRIYERYGPLKIDFLKVSHHGSYTGTSPYLIGNILPEYAIISTNGKYDHPSPETLDTLERYLVKYLITKHSGNIDIYFSRVLDFIKTSNNDFVIINRK